MIGTPVRAGGLQSDGVHKGLLTLLALSLMFAVVGPAGASEHVVAAGSGSLEGNDSDVDEQFIGSNCFEATHSIYALRGEGTYHGWDADGEEVVYSAQVGEGEELHEAGPIQLEVQATQTYYHGPNGTHGTEDDQCSDGTLGTPVPAEFRLFAEDRIHDGSGQPCTGEGEFWREGGFDPGGDPDQEIDPNFEAEWTLTSDCVVEGNAAGTPGSGTAPAGTEQTLAGVHEPCFNPPCVDNIRVGYDQFLATIEPDPGAIDGTVTDADTGEAIEGATVTADSESTTTASDGSYEIAGLDAGDYTVSADADGYQSASQGATVEAGASTTADFALDPVVEDAGEVAGTVTDADTGEAIEGATVTADGVEVTTDADGGYSIAELELGTYTVTAEADGYQLASQGATVEAGASTTADFALDPVVEDAGEVAGTVTDADTGDALAGATVSTDTGESTTTASDGSYEIAGLDAGDYTVSADADGYESATEEDVAVVGGETTTVDFALRAQSEEPPADPTTKDDCKNGGWQDHGFRNQGQCIRFVNTGKDSRQPSSTGGPAIAEHERGGPPAGKGRGGPPAGRG